MASRPETSGPRAQGERDPLRRWRAVGVSATAAIALAVPLHLAVRSLRAPRAAPVTEAQFVGSERCKACHEKAYDRWRGSNHAKAMQAARDGTVSGDFGGAAFQHRGKTWRFFRRGEKFMVNAEGPDGAMRDFEVAYTFGVDPLQQYLVVFPGGRLQALSAAWDTRARRWFYVNPGPDSPPGGELLDRYLPALLAPGAFHPDGQILDEDFEWHAFTQSKMYANGVRCSDCHDVHSGKRHEDGNALCTRCHRADTYDVAAHHFHAAEWKGKPSPGVACVSCHMPGQRFMVVHLRRDHSMRVPRPDLTAALGVPNACSAAGCHADRPLAWVQSRYDAW